MADVGELFVRVRPDTAGFTEEAQPGVASSGSKLGKIFVAAFAAVGLGDIVKHTVEAAVQQQQQFAILNKTVTNAGAANQVHGESIDNLVKQQAALKGFSVGDIAASFQKLVSVTNDSSKAFTLLGAAENLSRGTGKDLTVSALAVQKAFEGSGTSLARYGIIIKPVTTAVDALKAQWAAAADSGATFTAAQKAQQAELLRTATLTDKLATGQEAIAAIQQRFGGAATTFADTAAGEWDRLKVSVDELEVSIGNALLPVIDQAAAKLVTWTTDLQHNQSLQRDVSAAAQDFATAFHDIETVITTVGPPLVALTNDVGGFGHALELVAAVLIAGKLSGALFTTATAETAVGAEAATATTYVSAFEAGLLKLSAIGAIAIPIVVSYEIQKHDAGLSNQISDFFHNVGTVLHENVPKGDDLLKLLIGDPGDAGKLGNEIWKLVGEPAGPTGAQAGTDFAKAFNDSALQGLENAGISQTVDPKAQKGIASFLSTFEGLGDAIKKDVTSGKAKASLTAAAEATLVSLRQGLALDTSDQALLAQQMADAVQQGALAVQQAVQQGKQGFNQIGQDIATSIGTYIDTPLTLAADALQTQADRISATYAGLSASLDIESQSIQTKADQINARYASLNASLDAQTARIGLRADKIALRIAGEGIELPGGHTLSANYSEAIKQLDTLLAKTKSPAGKQALQQFIDSYESAHIKVAKDQIAIAEAVKPKTAAESARIAVRRDQITAAELPTPARAAARAQITFAQDVANTTKIQTEKTLADITDLFNRHKIQWTTLSRDVTDLLKRDKLNWGDAGRVDGVAFVDQLKAQLKGLKLQGQANALVPSSASGLIPSITHPLTTLENSQKTIAGIAHQQRANQLAELQAHTKILKLINGAQKGTAATNTSLAKNPGTETTKTAKLTGVSGG